MSYSADSGLLALLESAGRALAAGLSCDNAPQARQRYLLHSGLDFCLLREHSGGVGSRLVSADLATSGIRSRPLPPLWMRAIAALSVGKEDVPGVVEL
jgi:hypothetical protein